MPRMDGYSLCRAIREDPNLGELCVYLHTSLSGVFNEQMVETVGADRFIAKYLPDELAGLIQQRLYEHAEKYALDSNEDFRAAI
jgi:two-component system chemotaxis response regulator CheV